MQSVDEHAMEPDWVSGEGPSCALALVLITFLGGRRGAVPGGCVQMGATVNATVCVRVAWGQVGWPLWPLRGPGVEGRRGEAPGARDRS